MKSRPPRSSQQPRPEGTKGGEPGQHEAAKARAIDVRDFIESLTYPPPAVSAESLLEHVADVLTPEQIREFILQHRFPPVWGRQMEADIRLRLEAAGFRRIKCRCLDEHPVIELRMSKAPGRRLPIREVMRLLRGIATELGQIIPRGGLTATVAGNRVEAALVMENPMA